MEKTEELESVRLDTWLNVSRAFKTRSQASRACELSRVRVNGVTSKPRRHVRPGDLVEIDVGDWTRVLEIKGLAEKPIAKALARELYEDRSPPRPDDPVARAMRRPAVLREAGAGRPTKKERREIEKLRSS